MSREGGSEATLKNVEISAHVQAEKTGDGNKLFANRTSTDDKTVSFEECSELTKHTHELSAKRNSTDNKTVS